ncbi:MAG TPA: cytochrome c3 family protein [Anaeromyxobacter sp.]
MAARAIASAVLALLAGHAAAFHSGGVGDCEGCHSMHGKDGPDVPGRPFLMSGGDASSTCLSCHAGMAPATGHVFSTGFATPPSNYTPAGDYAWLLRSYVWNGPKGVATSPGERHGHSVVAADFNLLGDTRNTAAPGGTYPSGSLSCISCHDPHGRYRILSDGTFSAGGARIVASGSYATSTPLPAEREAYGSYRLLGGRGYQPRSLGGALSFGSNPPVAIAPPAYNRSEAVSDVRVAYGSGMSEWCANCHGAIHTSANPTGPGSYQHPSGVTARFGQLASIYNAFLRTGDMGGSWLTAYTSLVPYEEGTTDRSQLASHARGDGTYRIGPTTGGENVMCLSCHRAHASGWDYGMRWNFESEYVVASGQWPGVDSVGEAAKPANAQGRTQAETRAAMYDRNPSSYASFQTTLCNKCHAK